MEVRFRPLESSTLASRAPLGQAGTEGGQSFLEMVESVAGAENSLREKTGSNPKRQTPNRWAPSETETLAATEPTDKSDAAKPAATPSPKAAATEKDRVGLQIDMTA